MGELQRHWGEPRDIEQALEMAGRIVKSGLTPKAVKTPEAALVIMMTGADLGLTPMESLRQIDVIEGKPSLSANLMVALVQTSGLAEFFVCSEGTQETCTYTTRRKGSPHEESITFTIDDARAAGLAGKNVWKSYPAAMLRHRASSQLARQVYPDVIGGLYTRDEIESFRDVEVSAFARDVTPIEPPAQIEQSETPRTPPLATLDEVSEVWNELRAALQLGPTPADTAKALEFAEAAGVSLPRSHGEVEQLGFSVARLSALRTAIAEHMREEAKHSMAALDETPEDEEETT